MKKSKLLGGIAVATVICCSLSGCLFEKIDGDGMENKVVNVEEEKKAYDVGDLEVAALNHYAANNSENYRPSMVASMVDEENPDIIYIQLYDNLGDHNSTSDWYEININTGKGTNILGEEVDLTNYINSTFTSKINFLDSSNLAIAYVAPETKGTFVNKYFEEGEYEKIEVLDCGSEEEFVIVPRYDDAEITIKARYYDEEGMLFEKEELITKHKGPLVIKSEAIEFMPKFTIYFSYNGYEYSLPVGFSGEDGKLILDGYEMDVMDITEYPGYNS